MLNIRELKRLRLEKKVTMRKMARRLGYASPCSYFRIEHGICQAKLDDVLKITKILEIPLSALLTSKQVI